MALPQPQILGLHGMYTRGRTESVTLRTRDLTGRYVTGCPAASDIRALATAASFGDHLTRRWPRLRSARDGPGKAQAASGGGAGAPAAALHSERALWPRRRGAARARAGGGGLRVRHTWRPLHR